MQAYPKTITTFVKLWNFTRAETLELLESLDNDKLGFKPKGPKWQTLFYQFGCMIRTQIVYTKAIKMGKMDNSWFHDPELMTKTEFKTKEKLKEKFEEINNDWISEIQSKREDEDFQISWPGYKLNLMAHISTLNSHERLHHGQLISYFTFAGYEFPKEFKENWAL